MSLTLIPLGLLDMLAGLMIMQPSWFPPALSQTAGLAVLILGTLSFARGYLKKDLGFAHSGGIIEIVGGVVMLTGFSFPVLWVLLMARGVYLLLIRYTRW